MALDNEARMGRDGTPLPLDMREGTLLTHHGLGGGLVRFEEYTTEVALPRKGGAVVRFSFVSQSSWDGVTDTAVAGELSLPRPVTQ